ncbi:MAG: ATP-dependent DNA helicase RecG [Actinomycetales bacterium]|nr:MAG: ATP-dependent DNA helicase RecG [Actinomycetales bacterium]
MPTAYTEDTLLRRVIQPAAAEALAKHKGLHTIGDLFEHVPRRYLEPDRPTDLSELEIGEEVIVVADVSRVSSHAMRSRNGYRLAAVITDGDSELELTFFSKRKYDFGLRPGRRGVFTGTVGSYQGRRQLTHPEMELFDEDQLSPERIAYLTSHKIPVYPATGKMTSARIRRLVEMLLDSIEQIREPLPAAVRRRRRLLGRREALELVHRPELGADISPGRRRLRFDEAYVLQVILAQRRRAVAELGGTARVPRPAGLLAAFDARLPFELTAGQQEVGKLLLAELARDQPMHRLLQGEVGSGKTVVALRAMLAVVDAGGQAALLAPTEVLAAQHHRTITTMLGDLAMGGMLGGNELGTRVALLTGSQSTTARRQALDDIVTGTAGIVVGTHALIQKHVDFFDLGLVVVDEQHRFGVEQRDALRDKSTGPPHLLVMTATPIPRTVAMTVFGDMETTTLRELPAGRSPIQTHIVDLGNSRWVERSWERLAEEIDKGHQVYVVCPRIGDPTDGSVLTNDTSDEDTDWTDWADHDSDPPESPGEPAMTGVYAAADQLRTQPALAGARIGVLHGRMPPEAKDGVMDAFGRGELDLLVATTVIEVGVDVPNATTMVIMDAERFGISQLHQLRGRVGRGTAPGLCLLFTAAPNPAAQRRLAAVAGSNDGFQLARIDLELRREGDVLGARQSGKGTSVRFLRVGNETDERLIAEAREDAVDVVASDPELAGHPELAARVAARLDETQAAYLVRG